MLRGGTALLLALLLCGAVGAGAAEMTDTRMLVPVGHTVGIKLFSRGVVVVKLSEGGTPAKAGGLQTGDVIVKCAGSSVTLSVEPEQNERGVYGIGAWIRDSMAGIGTMTYYDPATGAFGALGHGIADVDTAQLMPFSNGSILPSTVKAVKKGESGAAGELRGDFDLTGDLGDLYANTSNGIFGILEADDYSPVLGDAVPVGRAQTGPAVIRSNVQGDTVEEFDIEIVSVTSTGSDGRDMVISVKDPDLISATGGIVQGMSGSPILQDGQLVGAVTHVLLNSPQKGYGISIQRMLATAESVA